MASPVLRWLSRPARAERRCALLFVLALLAAQISILPLDEGGTRWSRFLIALVCSSVFVHWLILGLVALPRSRRERWAFRVYLSARLRPAVPPLGGGLLLMLMLPTFPGGLAMLASWGIGCFLVLNTRLPRRVVGGLTGREVEQARDALFIFYGAGAMILTLWMLSRVRPVISMRAGTAGPQVPHVASGHPV